MAARCKLVVVFAALVRGIACISSTDTPPALARPRVAVSELFRNIFARDRGAHCVANRSKAPWLERMAALAGDAGDDAGPPTLLPSMRVLNATILSPDYLFNASLVACARDGLLGEGAVSGSVPADLCVHHSGPDRPGLFGAYYDQVAHERYVLSRVLRRAGTTICGDGARSTDELKARARSSDPARWCEAAEVVYVPSLRLHWFVLNNDETVDGPRKLCLTRAVVHAYWKAVGALFLQQPKGAAPHHPRRRAERPRARVVVVIEPRSLDPDDMGWSVEALGRKPPGFLDRLVLGVQMSSRPTAHIEQLCARSLRMCGGWRDGAARDVRRLRRSSSSRQLLARRAGARGSSPCGRSLLSACRWRDGAEEELRRRERLLAQADARGSSLRTFGGGPLLVTLPRTVGMVSAVDWTSAAAARPQQRRGIGVLYDADSVRRGKDRFRGMQTVRPRVHRAMAAHAARGGCARRSMRALCKPGRARECSGNCTANPYRALVHAEVVIEPPGDEKGRSHAYAAMLSGCVVAFVEDGHRAFVEGEPAWWAWRAPRPLAADDADRAPPAATTATAAGAAGSSADPTQHHPVGDPAATVTLSAGGTLVLRYDRFATFVPARQIETAAERAAAARAGGGPAGESEALESRRGRLARARGASAGPGESEQGGPPWLDALYRLSLDAPRLAQMRAELQRVLPFFVYRRDDCLSAGGPAVRHGGSHDDGGVVICDAVSAFDAVVARAWRASQRLR